MHVSGYPKTDVGRVRDHNEDAFLQDDQLGLYIVADGVGGHSAGEVASGMLVEAVHRQAAALAPYLSAFHPDDVEIRRYLLQAIPQTISAGSEAIYRHAVEHPECQGMATTAVMFLAAGSHAFVSHVGDSRLYLLRGQHFQQITEDHTLVRKMVKEGLLTPEDAAVHPQRNVIIRSAGLAPSVEADSLLIDIRPADLFVLCSDGLTDMVNDQEIYDLALRYHDDALATALVQRANARGGRDNITVMILEVAEEDPDKTAIDHGMFDLFGRVEFLKNIFMFQTLTEQERIKVNRCLYEQVFRHGQPIVSLDEEGDELYIIADGVCVVEKFGVVLVEIPAGGHFGELAFISRDRRSATVRAMGDVVCFVLSRQDLHELLRDDAVLGNKLLWAFLENLGTRVKELSSDIAELKAGLAR